MVKPIVHDDNQNYDHIDLIIFYLYLIYVFINILYSSNILPESSNFKNRS